jgi:hypothetical protein
MIWKEEHARDTILEGWKLKELALKVQETLRSG